MPKQLGRTQKNWLRSKNCFRPEKCVGRLLLRAGNRVGAANSSALVPVIENVSGVIE